MNRSKVTETSRVVQTSTFKTEGSATTTTRYETGATSIEHGMWSKMTVKKSAVTIFVYTKEQEIHAWIAYSQLSIFDQQKYTQSLQSLNI